MCYFFSLSAYQHLFDARAVLADEPEWYYLIRVFEVNKIVPTFSLGICTNVNVIVLLEFELAYTDFTWQYIGHDTMRIPDNIQAVCNLSY